MCIGVSGWKSFGKKFFSKIHGTQHMKNIPHKQISGCQNVNLKMSLLEEQNNNCNMIAQKERIVNIISVSKRGKYFIQPIRKRFFKWISSTYLFAQQT